MADYVLVAFTSILFAVDPLGVVPSYLVMTRGNTPEQQRRTSLRAALTATGTLLLFAALGNSVLQIFGVSLGAFQIAGGIVLLFVALDMLRARRPTQERPDEVAEGVEKEDITITPLAIPMLAGPAALSTVTLLMQQAADWQQVVALVSVILIIGVLMYATLRLAAPFHRLLGPTGIHVVSRILGLLLLAIAVEFILDGLQSTGALPSRAP